MEHGPLPPHERTWRHPSELAAEEHAVARAESPGVTTRAFAFTSGTLGLLAVGLLVLAVSPDRSSAPVAISATTTPLDRPSEVAASASASTGPVALRGRPEALATPVGDGRYAVVTAADLTEHGGATRLGSIVDVAVPSGRTVAAVIVAHADDTVLVELDRPEPGHAVARAQPAGHEIVTVLAVPPVTVVLDDLHELEVEEGTAVLDETGELVGLCSQDGDDAIRLVPVREMAMDDTAGTNRDDGFSTDDISGDDAGADAPHDDPDRDVERRDGGASTGAVSEARAGATTDG